MEETERTETQEEQKPAAKAFMAAMTVRIPCNGQGVMVQVHDPETDPSVVRQATISDIRAMSSELYQEMQAHKIFEVQGMLEQLRAQAQARQSIVKGNGGFMNGVRSFLGRK